MADQAEFIVPGSLIDRLLGRWLPREEPSRGEGISRIPGFSRRPGAMAAWLGGADFVLAPTRLTRARCIDAGIAPEKAVHVGFGIEEALRARWKAVLEKSGLPALARLAADRGDEQTLARFARGMAVKYRQAVSHRSVIGEMGGE
jgi:hypothetical protein